MHQVSQHTIETAHSHALKTVEHGKLVEDLGKSLQNVKGVDPEIVENIARHGEIVQKKSQEFLEITQQLAENSSSEVFVEAVQAHVEATAAHVDAIESHIEANKKFLGSTPPLSNSV